MVQSEPFAEPEAGDIGQPQSVESVDRQHSWAWGHAAIAAGMAVLMVGSLLAVGTYSASWVFFGCFAAVSGFSLSGSV
jgi:hypothetical protein